MMTSLVLAVLTVPAAEPAKEPPAKLELFATEDWYKSQKGKEADFVGVLMFKERPKDVVGFDRFNPYTLVMTDGTKTTVREVYVGGKPELLKPYIGKRVKLTGKAVDMEVEGKDHREIWPARLEVVPAEKKDEKKPEQAREEAVLNDLAGLLSKAESDREKAARELEQALRVLDRHVQDVETGGRGNAKDLRELRRELLQQAEQFYREAAEKKPEAEEPPQKKADILANHKLYKMEPGAEKEYVGVIQKEEKGGYTLLTQVGKVVGKMSLHLYPDAGDPLGPYVGKKVRLLGKYQAGATGTRTFEFVLPGRLEVIEEKQRPVPKPEEKNQTQKDIDELVRLLRAIEEKQAEEQQGWIRRGTWKRSILEGLEEVKPEPRRDPVTIHALPEMPHLFPESEQPPAGSKPGIDPEVLKRALEGKK
jgi:hypothetical protein